MPEELWHNVSMAQTVTLPLSPPPFSFDWREIERGLPLKKLDEFSAYSGIAVKDLMDVVIPARTLKHRRQKNELLSAQESDRLARVAKMFELAAKVYGNREDGKEFLKRHMPRFDEKTPLEVLRTGRGEEAVQEFLIQIDEGMYI
jgi:putative toxin-antitoxin system antitoxin component (TIGR02293 family)